MSEYNAMTEGAASEAEVTVEKESVVEKVAWLLAGLYSVATSLVGGFAALVLLSGGGSALGAVFALFGISLFLGFMELWANDIRDDAYMQRHGIGRWRTAQTD